MSAGMSLMTGNTAGMMSSLFVAAKGAFESNQSHEKTKKTKTSPADVVMWSGCKDSQTVCPLVLLPSFAYYSSNDYSLNDARLIRDLHDFHVTPFSHDLAVPLSGQADAQSADTQEEGAATGAMSYAFISSLKKNPRQTYQGLLQTIREELRGRS